MRLEDFSSVASVLQKLGAWLALAQLVTRRPGKSSRSTIFTTLGGGDRNGEATKGSTLGVCRVSALPVLASAWRRMPDVHEGSAGGDPPSGSEPRGTPSEARQRRVTRVPLDAKQRLVSHPLGSVTQLA